MNRLLCVGTFLLAVAGCRLCDDRTPRLPLADNTPPLPYAELLTRARLLANAANEAFFEDRWGELESAAGNLEQTARFMVNKVVEVPAKQKESLAARGEALAADAVKLRDAAHMKDAKLSNEIMQRINLKVRDLRLED